MVEASLVNLVELGVLVVGVVIAIFQLRDIKETRETELDTRQAQLYIQIFNHMIGPDFLRKYNELVLFEEYKDFEDFREKHLYDAESRADVVRLAGFFEGLGLLGEQNLLDVKLMSRLMGGNLIKFWDKLGPIIEEWREYVRDPYLWEYVEYLYNQVRNIRETRPPAYVSKQD